MKKAKFFLLLLLVFTVKAYAETCGGKGYGGKDNLFCLKCHSGCPFFHVVDEVKVKEGECLKIPPSFPMKNGKMVCTTCHDMTSERKAFLRTKGGGKFEKRIDFCFQCHNPECYKKFNPHKVIASQLAWEKKKRACIYCHGVGAELEAYKACVGCHTKNPHVGALEHLLAEEKKVMELVREKEGIVNITSLKDLKPKIDEKELRKRKPKLYLVNWKIECITCHNPHPQIAFSSEKLKDEWLKVEELDLEYKLEKLHKRLENLTLNREKASLLSAELKSGELCMRCHSFKLLK
jgi:hypothetical protein